MYILRLWIFFGALLSLNALDRWNERCIAVTINASLKSEVLLPCNFVIGNYNETESVNWEHYSRLVTITINGKILFDSPTEGRVNVFPLLSKHGNFSILIHDLQASDIGTYFCKLNSECRRVNIIERPDISQIGTNESSPVSPWFYFAAGAGLFILIFIGFTLLSKFYGNNSPEERQNAERQNAERQNAESNEHRNKKKRGVRRGPSTVYENDIHAPNQSSAVQQGQRPQRVFRAVPEPTRSNPSDVIPYYVNQTELSIPANTGQKRKKQKHYQFKNPIYAD
ncbi:hypothetical protein Q8A67_018477 [Cirrhinus molitorella]|uniref:Ig-like domain-containing protein n=1 Tax=Cirrhinus molitorella TaxID=172907 RepID=A0AA88PG51_9TELE|nr:hypothetical protein Q8A67_018477 [Cirrhinus molitorella]